MTYLIGALAVAAFGYGMDGWAGVLAALTGLSAGVTLEMLAERRR